MKRALLGRHGGPYLKSQHSGRLQQEDSHFKPSVGNLDTQKNPVSK